MIDLLYLIFVVGAFCFYISVVIPAAAIIFHKVIRHDGMTVKEILREINF